MREHATRMDKGCFCLVCLNNDKVVGHVLLIIPRNISHYSLLALQFSKVFYEVFFFKNVVLYKSTVILLSHQIWPTRSVCRCIYLQDSCPLPVFSYFLYILLCSGCFWESSLWQWVGSPRLLTPCRWSQDYVQMFLLSDDAITTALKVLQHSRKGGGTFTLSSWLWISCGVHQQHQVEHVISSDYMWLQCVNALSFSLLPLEPDTPFYFHTDLVRLEPH